MAVRVRAKDLKLICIESDIRPTATSIAASAGLSPKVIRKALHGDPISIRTWEALVRAFPGADIFDWDGDRPHDA